MRAISIKRLRIAVSAVIAADPFCILMTLNTSLDLEDSGSVLHPDDSEHFPGP